MNKNNKMPIFEECLEIVKNNETFTHRVRIVDGYEVSVFDYMLAQFKDFQKPIEGSDLTAFELRGLCFTHNTDGSIHRRYILLHKFFNVNQSPGYQFDELKDLKIKGAMDKMDGSVMRFIELPNGKVVSKSKTFFCNDQTKMADQVLASEKNLEEFVNDTLAANICAVFELTSPLNRIVLSYKETELTLLRMRDEETGEYLDIYNHPLVLKHKIKVCKSIAIKPLIAFMEESEKVEGIEGYILEFEGLNGETILAKRKTDWYYLLHGILTEKLAKEDCLVQLVIDGTIDDALAELDPADERKPVIEDLCHKMNHYLLVQFKIVQELVSKFNGNKKEWAMTNNGKPHFTLAARLIANPENNNEEFIIEYLKREIKQDNYKLEKSKVWLKENLNFELMIKNYDEN